MKYEVPLVGEIQHALRDGRYNWAEMSAIQADLTVAQQEYADSEMAPTVFEKHAFEEHEEVF